MCRARRLGVSRLQPSSLSGSCNERSDWPYDASRLPPGTNSYEAEGMRRWVPPQRKPLPECRHSSEPSAVSERVRSGGQRASLMPKAEAAAE